MAFSYPEFHGRSDEDVEDFLERMEIACISNHLQAPVQMLRILQLCLKGDARAWSKAYEEELQSLDPPIAVTLEGLKEALAGRFVKIEDPDKVWQEIQVLRQGERELVDGYIKKFSSLWERLCRALQPQASPPDMMKKDRFLLGLVESLRFRVELKKPRTYEDTVEVARSKDWKLRKMAQLGMESLPKVPQPKPVDPVQSQIPREVHHHVTMENVTSHAVPTMVAATVPDDGLRQEMRQVVDLMKNLSLNLLSDNCGHGRPQNQPREGGQNSGKR